MQFPLSRFLFVIYFMFLSGIIQAQNVGVGTATTATRLDVAGLNAWDLQNTEGDMRVGNGTYRLKFGVALGGGGAGAAAIMQYGATNGYNVLSLGSQGKYILSLNGETGRAGIGVSTPSADLEISGTGPSIPRLQLTQPQGIFSPVRMRFNNSLNSKYWDIISYGGDDAVSSHLTFYNNNSGSASFGINGKGALELNGNPGNSGQTLHSSGDNQPAYWASSTNQLYSNTNMMQAAGPLVVPQGGNYSNVPGLSATFTTTGPAKVLVMPNVAITSNSCAFCAASVAYIMLYMDGSSVEYRYRIANGETHHMTGTYMFTVGAGTHTIRMSIASLVTDITVAPGFVSQNTITYQVIPQ